MDMDVILVKIGNRYISTKSLERFLIIDKELYLSTSGGNEFSPSDKMISEDDVVMSRVIRKINEKAHDIIYIEASVNNDESKFEEDQTGNLLYRKWLEENEHTNKPPSREHDKPTGKNFWKKLKPENSDTPSRPDRGHRQ